MKKAYLIHGTSTRDDDWFPWLEKAARPEIELDRLWLPDPFAPQQAAWDQAVDDQIKAEDGITLVAHSLGCITAVRWLARHDVKNVGLLLVGRLISHCQTMQDWMNLCRAVLTIARYGQRSAARP